MKLLDQKTAIITGASRGIGRGIALTFAQNGCAVAFTYSSSTAAAEQLETELKALGVNAKGYQSNAADFEAAQQLVEDVMADFGQIDILINNAGITKDNLLMRMGEADFDSVININLKSVFNMTKAVQRTFLKQRHGSLIHMSSVVGVKGNAGQANYAASKAGIIGFSKSIALELGSRNIRSNVIAPGFIDAGMSAPIFADEKVRAKRSGGVPLHRLGTAADVISAVLYLASDAAAYIHGHELVIDGGVINSVLAHLPRD